MERQKSVKHVAGKHTPSPAPKWMLWLIVVFHVVGILGFAINKTRPLFINLVPYHLLLMLVIVVKSHHRFNSKFLAFFSAVFLTGYFVEWVGTYTGWFFGSYSYGDTLGTKVFDVPLLIGVNWFLLVYATGVTLRLSGMRIKTLRALTGAALLTVLDLLIEPVAMRFSYWQWEFETVPFTNYLCWFFVSFVLLSLFEAFRFRKQSLVAVVFLVMQFIFFGVLCLV